MNSIGNTAIYSPHECPICFIAYNDEGNKPKALNCGHTFCEKCAEKFWEQDHIKCPKDRQITPIGAVTLLPKNFLALEFIEAQQSPNPDPKCMSNCSNEAWFKCVTCSKSYCDNCFRRVHGYGNDHVTRVIQTLQPKCYQHPGTLAEYTCKDEKCETKNKHMCDECFVKNHTNHSHEVVGKCVEDINFIKHQLLGCYRVLKEETIPEGWTMEEIKKEGTLHQNKRKDASLKRKELDGLQRKKRRWVEMEKNTNKVRDQFKKKNVPEALSLARESQKWCDSLVSEKIDLARGQAGGQARPARLAPHSSHWIPTTQPDLLNMFWTAISAIEDPKHTSVIKDLMEFAIGEMFKKESKTAPRKQNLMNSVKILIMVGWLHSRKTPMRKRTPFLKLDGILEAEEVKMLIQEASTWIELAGKEEMMLEFRSYVNWNGFPKIGDQFKKIKDKILELVKAKNVRDQAAGKSDEDIFLEVLEVLRIRLEWEMADCYGWPISPSDFAIYMEWDRGNQEFLQKMERGMIQDLAVEEAEFDIMMTWLRKLDA